MTSNPPCLKSSPRNLLLSGFPLASPCGIAEALSNCSAAIEMLADLFGVDSDKSGYDILSDETTRYGVWLLLQGVADTLKAAREVATVDPNQRVGGEVTIPFSKGDWARLQALAQQRATSVEGIIEGMIASGLEQKPAPAN